MYRFVSNPQNDVMEIPSMYMYCRYMYYNVSVGLVSIVTTDELPHPATIVVMERAGFSPTMEKNVWAKV